ncbi:MAG: nuclear transport factor 2 family protein [Cytophagaceae bacterium]|nr:nuclear transport factor 2 family protein [Cytophagaceae bacterium]
MKKPLLLLALLLTSAATFAQSAFTKATLEGILNDYHKNPHDFLESYCPPDFRYITPDGSFRYLPQLLKGSVNDKVETSQILDQKIIQSGDVAVVSGIHEQKRVATDGTKTTRRVACTYTFKRQAENGSAPQWKFVASQQNDIDKKDSPK